MSSTRGSPARCSASPSGSERAARGALRLAGLVAGLTLTGCTGGASPSVPMFGAYFPAWLISAVSGAVGAVCARALFIAIGLDDRLPFRLAVYTALAALIGCAVSLSVYGR